MITAQDTYQGFVWNTQHGGTIVNLADDAPIAIAIALWVAGSHRG